MIQIRDLLIGPKEPDIKNVGWVSFDKNTQKYELKFYINGRWLPIVSNIDTIEPEKIEEIKELIEWINNNGTDFNNSKVSSIIWNNYNDPSNMNDFVVAGMYNIKGEHTRINDNLPILNTGGGHTFNARLTVLDSSITGSGENDDKCITQILSFDNRLGQGEVYIRTGKGRTHNSLTWEPWSTLQRNVNVGQVDTLDNLIDNGIYSGVWTKGSYNSYPLTFVCVVINDYFIGITPRRVSQFVYGLSKFDGSVIYQSRIWDDSKDKWGDWEILNKNEITSMISEEIKKITDGIDPEKIDSIKDIVAWIDAHGGDVTAIYKAINENRNNININKDNIANNSIAIGNEEYRATKAEKTLQKNIDNTNNIVGTEEKGKLTVYIGAVMKDGSTYSTNNSAYTNAFEGGDIAVTNEGYFIYDVRKVSADGVAEMVAVKSKRLRTEKGYTYQLNISKDGNGEFSNDELKGIVGLYNYDSSEIEKNKTDIQYLFEEAVKFDSFEVEELGDGIGINYNTIDGNSGSSIEISFATEERAGVMSAEDKKALDDVPKNIAKEKTAIVNGDTIAGLAREVYSRTGKVDTATFLKRTTAGGTTISDGVASIKEIGGNIVKNLVDGTDITKWNSYSDESFYKDGVFVARSGDLRTNQFIYKGVLKISGHIYYQSCYVYCTQSTNLFLSPSSGYSPWVTIQERGKWVYVSLYKAITTNLESNNSYMLRAQNSTDLFMTKPLLIDLTEMFGAGKEPTKEECDRLFGNMDALPQGLTIAKPTGLKSVGYNQWNPVNVLRNKSIVENSIEDDVENSHIAVVECLPCKIGEGENNGYVIGYGEGEQWDEDGIEVYFSPLNPMNYIDQDVDLYMHKLEQDATYGTYVPQCKGYLLVVTPTTDKLCVNFHWSGDRSKLDYEEYTESNVALPEIPQMSEWGLAGIQSSGTLVADTIDLDRMVYTKRVYKKVFNGNEVWNKSGNEFYSTGIKPASVNRKQMINLIGYKRTSIINTPGTFLLNKEGNTSTLYIYPLESAGVTDVATWKAYLANNPLEIYYEVAKPEEYPIVTKTAPNYIGSDYGVEEFVGSKIPLNANILFYMRSLVGETRNFLDRLYDNTDKTDAKEVADYITNGIEGNKELATNAPNLALRKLFLAAGAEYNDTDQIIQKTAPWKTEEKWRLEDDGTYTYWEEPAIVEHLPKHYYLNGLGDITEEEMMTIYIETLPMTKQSEWINSIRDATVRTNLFPKLFYAAHILKKIDAAFYNTKIEVIRTCYTDDLATTLSQGFLLNECSVKYIYGVWDVKSFSNLQSYAMNNKNLRQIKIKNLKGNATIFNKSQHIYKRNILYAIQNAFPTTAITITLHPDAYARIANQPDIIEALEAQPLVTLVSA